MEDDGIDDGSLLVVVLGRASCRGCGRERVEAWRGWRGERQQRARARRMMEVERDVEQAALVVDAPGELRWRGVGLGEKERQEAGVGCSLVEEKQVRKQTSEEGRGRAVQRSFCVG